MTATARKAYDIDIEDVEYLRHGDQPLLARLFMPLMPIGMAIIVRQRGWGVFNVLPVNVWLELMSKPLGVKVIEVDQDRRRLIFSEREAQKEWRQQQKARLLSELMEGDVVTMQEIFKFEQTSVSPEGKALGELRPTVIRPLFTPRLEAAGFKLGPEVFGAKLQNILAQGRR